MRSCCFISRPTALLVLALACTGLRAQSGGDSPYSAYGIGDLQPQAFTANALMGGTGVALDDMKNVFDAFWSTKAGGMGIGLAICQSIITAHRGTLTVANNPDGGATFCATLPMWQT